MCECVSVFVCECVVGCVGVGGGGVGVDTGVGACGGRILNCVILVCIISLLFDIILHQTSVKGFKRTHALVHTLTHTHSHTHPHTVHT